MKIAILNYEISTVKIMSIPPMDSDDEIESWINEHLGFKAENIAWMSADHIDVEVNL